MEKFKKFCTGQRTQHRIPDFHMTSPLNMWSIFWIDFSEQPVNVKVYRFDDILVVFEAFFFHLSGRRIQPVVAMKLDNRWIIPEREIVRAIE